jgi:hypothetical protein
MLLINYHILGLKKGEALHPAGCFNDNIRLGTLPCCHQLLLFRIYFELSECPRQPIIRCAPMPSISSVSFSANSKPKNNALDLYSNIDANFNILKGFRDEGSNLGPEHGEI